MAILEKEILITLGTNIKYFEELGYFIPRIKNTNGVSHVKRGTKILVKIEHVLRNSPVTVTKICDICGEKVLNQKYQNVILKREKGDGLDRCLKCSREKAATTRRNNVKYDKSLEYFANKNDKKYLLLEFSNKNKKIPSEISYGTKDEYLWNCHECNSEYLMKVQNRTKKDCGCTFCSGKRINETNCLATLYPELSKEWHPTKNGDLTPYNVTKGKKGKLWWLCPDCKSPYSSTVNDRRSGCSCPQCAESKGEKRIREWLESNGYRFEPQKEFPELLGMGGGLLSYDFYLSKHRLLIEYQGEFHDGSKGDYTKVNLKKQQEHDKRKREYAEQNDIELFEIWYWDFDKIEKILESKLKNKEESHD